MVAAGLSIKLRCASWQQLATIYKRDLSKGSMFLKAAAPPPLGTKVRIDLTLPSSSVIALSGTVKQHVDDAQRGKGVDLALDPLPSSSVWLIESALAAEMKTGRAATSPGSEMALSEAADVANAEEDLVKALLAENESLKKLNPFLVLGVGYEASDADVRAAFGELTKRYHPDRFARYESKDLRGVAAEIFILIRDAYRKLGDETSRAQVLAQLGKGAAPRAVPSKAPPPAVPSVTRPGGQPRPGTPPPMPSSSRPGAPRPGNDGSAPAPRPQPPGPPPGRATPAAGVPVLLERAATGPVAVIPASPKAAPPPQPPTQTQPAPLNEPRPVRSTNEHDAATVVPGRGTGANAAVPQPVGKQPSQPHAAPAPVRTPTPTPTPSASPTTTPSPATRAAPPPPPQPQPPPLSPMVETGRPVLAQPPPVIEIAESGDTTALEDMLDNGRVDDALAAYKLLAKKHPSDRGFRAGIELCEGLRALTARDRLEAAQRFETALEIDPRSERAARELAEMRRQATNERKGLLSRLMGKKEG